MTIPLKFASAAQLNTVLLADAMRWPDDDRTRSIFSPSFAKAARLAYRYMLHRYGFQKLAQDWRA